MTTIPDHEKLARLPLWAQNEIAGLRRRVDQLEAAAGVITGDVKRPGVYLHNVLTNSHRPLGADAVLRFQVIDGTDNPNYGFGRIEAMLSARTGPPRLYLRSPHGALFIRPDGANTIYVEAPGGW